MSRRRRTAGRRPVTPLERWFVIIGVATLVGLTGGTFTGVVIVALAGVTDNPVAVQLIVYTAIIVTTLLVVPLADAEVKRREREDR